jgi:hypothetical protein
VPDDTEESLPSEERDLSCESRHFTTLAEYRLKQFPLVKAVHQYHLDPVAYALGLAEVADEICEVVHQKDPAGYRDF